ncbi:MAG TPA: hypothetical protein VK369_12140, partial [Segetibacter sp.]|nr:hypothetical protein [Segetibacter sp.]
MRAIIIILTLLFITTAASAQSVLNKAISINITALPLEKALQLISNKGNFYFSYNSNIIPKNKQVSYTANNKSIREVLDVILEAKYECIESNNYVILKLLPAKLVIITKQAVLEERLYAISGYVFEEETKMKISDASIFEKKQLALATTNNQGFFKIRLKSKYNKAALTISKEMYNDTTVEVSPRYNQTLNVSLIPSYRTYELTTIRPQDYLIDTSYSTLLPGTPLKPSITRIGDTIEVEKTRAAKFLLSTRQKIQSLNLKNFFTSRPYQVSFTPGLSSQGKLSAQVTNNISLNVLGGYTGGVNGVEVGGLFNINKRNVKYAQVAGLLNINGESMFGAQVAGLNNTVLGGVNGVHAAGISNIVRGQLNGVQVAGIYNHVSNTVKGIQVAGISNFAKEKVNGMQISGIGNIAYRQMNGIQAGGIFNYAKRLRGVQIGLINIADTSEGYSIGLLNIILKGYHKLAITSNELMNVNASFKTGNKKLYSILMAGYNYGNDAKIYSFGYGIGNEIKLNNLLSINPELSAQYLYRGNIFDLNLLGKFNLDLHLNFGKHFSIFGGPSFNAYNTNQQIAVPGYKSVLPKEGFKTFKVTSQTEGWIGWNIGVSFF